MDLGLEYLRPHFGRIIGDPKHITECIGDHCRKIVPLQTRTYATIQLEQLDKPTANYTLQHSLKMVAKFMLCDECRCPKSRAKIARKWIAEGRKYLTTIQSHPSASENDSQLLPIHYSPTSASYSIHDIRRPDNRNAHTPHARNLSGRDGTWHSQRYFVHNTCSLSWNDLSSYPTPSR